MHPGDGWVLQADSTRMAMPLGERVLLGAADTDGAVTVLLAEATGPEGPPLHAHESMDELSFVVAGGPLTVQLGDDVHELGPGGGYWAPRGVAHTFANFSSSPAMVVSVVTPGGMEGLLAAQGDYLASLPTGEMPDPARVAEIGAAHASTVVGPPLAATIGAANGGSR